LLSKLAYPINVYHATNGLEAIDFCKNHPETKLVFMDLKMPGLNGFETSKHIKAIRPNLPIIAQTTYSTETDRKKAFAAGCTDFISKPFRKEEFYQLIEEYLLQ